MNSLKIDTVGMTYRPDPDTVLRILIPYYAIDLDPRLGVNLRPPSHLNYSQRAPT